MALNSSGPISLGGATSGQSINLELGQSATAQVSLNDTNVRSLAGVASGAITMPTNFYGKSTATSSGMYWIGTSDSSQDEDLSEFTGTYVVPTGITSLSAVCIGAGGNWQAPQYKQSGGALAYATFAVTPGETLTVTVANMVASSAGGGISAIKRGGTTLVGAYSAFKDGTAGTVIAGTGGSGGTGGDPYTFGGSGTGNGGGGGAGGYSGNGGAGGNAANAGTDPMDGFAGSNGNGGGGGGGGGPGFNGGWGIRGGGGGVGPFGAGSSGTGGAGGDGIGGDSNAGNGTSGSGGGSGVTYGAYFGGSGGGTITTIGPGAVRIITQGSAYPTGFSQITNEALFTTAGATTWTVPAGVTSVSVCCMGGGGGGTRSDTTAGGGGGGGMRWYNNLTVTPGAVINLTVGAGGTGAASPTVGGDTWFNGTSIGTASVYGGGGNITRLGQGGVGGTGSTIGGSIGGNDGGQGGNYSSVNAGGGGGAAGLFGVGGTGGIGGTPPTSSTGGGGGGGYFSSGQAGGGGGTGPYPGKNGAAGTSATTASNLATGGGFYFSSGSGVSLVVGYSTLKGQLSGAGGFGGGGGGGNDSGSGSAGNGGRGWVRVIWPGTDRTFPSKCGQ